jgi:hypothetical protein
MKKIEIHDNNHCLPKQNNNKNKQETAPGASSSGSTITTFCRRGVSFAADKNNPLS